jgi:hypothetical protein
MSANRGWRHFNPYPFSNPDLAAGVIASGFFVPRQPRNHLTVTRSQPAWRIDESVADLYCVPRHRNCPAGVGAPCGLFAGTDFMPSAIEQIVDIYVRLKNRRGLDELMMHRQRLAVDLKSRSGYDFSLPIGQIDEEIAIIEAGLSRLKAGDTAATGNSGPA